ncbi:transcriptional regulator [Kribbella antibiotica]|uniref:Transcriptional regulator n=1 Tax=Kribbella antibiotica TaxID=190195 RepID=A0A4R4ZSJ1_9ACTN|nr:helix-turn-helix domain-containing protein [Kribbella antibiotica]TDD62003.1 transcriptional regulator [Kribbella antibiotica]
MPRREVGLDERPQHLREFAEALRDVRRQSGLTLKVLSTLTHYAESTLSRATNALVLPPWPQVKAFVLACGGGDIDRWKNLWEATRRQHDLFVSEGVTEAPTSKIAQAVRKQELEYVTSAERPATLSAFLQKAETAQDLVRAIRLLGERTGTVSLRQMEARCQAVHVRIAKSTIRDWLAGERRPTKLDQLVAALGATTTEQRHFAQCLERVWAQNPPVLQLSLRPRWDQIGTKRGGHCITLRLVSDRALMGGLAAVLAKAEGQSAAAQEILGVSIGPEHAMIDGLVLLPEVRRKGEFEIGLWVSAPLKVASQTVELSLQLKTTDQRGWPSKLKLHLPSYTPPLVAEAAAVKVPEVPPARVRRVVEVSSVKAPARRQAGVRRGVIPAVNVDKAGPPILAGVGIPLRAPTSWALLEPRPAAAPTVARTSPPSRRDGIAVVPLSPEVASTARRSRPAMQAELGSIYQPKHRRAVPRRGLVRRLFRWSGDED